MQRPPNTSEQSTIEMIRRRVDMYSMQSERVLQEEVVLKNMAFFSGKHHFFIEDGRFIDATSEIPVHKVLYSVNLTRAALARAAAKVMNVRAEFRAAPQSGSIRHRNIAEVSDRVFAHVREVNEWELRTALLATMWAGLAGSSFLWVNWDPTKGEKDRFYFNAKNDHTIIPELLLSQQDRNAKDAELLFQDLSRGEVTIDVESIYSTYHDWSARDKGVAGAHWMARKKYVDIDRVAERFGIDPADLQSEEASQGLASYEEAIAFMSSHSAASPYQYQTVEDKRGKRCMMVELFERPSRQYRKGRHVVYAGRKIIKDGPNPYVGDLSEASHLPVVKQDWMPHPGRFWGCSLVEDLTNPQHHLNESRSALLEFLRCFGRPSTFVDANSGLDPKQMTIDPGGVYTINTNSRAPTHSPTPNLPPAVTEVGELMRQDLMGIASQSDVEGSAIPSQLRSGEAVKSMVEYRDIALSIPSNEAVGATLRVGKIALALARMYYGEKRTLRYLDADSNEFMFKDFAGADLTNDLVIVGQPSVLDTLQSRKAEVLDAVQSGAIDPINNPADRDLVLGAMHWHESDSLMKTKLRARRNQEYEIQQMIADPLKYGEVGYPAVEWEDHEREIEVLVNFMYTVEFKALPRPAQVMITMHWKAHMQFQQQKLMQAMAMAEATKGTPGQKGKASQPAK